MPFRSASLMFGHDEPGLGRDGDAHVHVVLVDDRVAVDLRVDDRDTALSAIARRLHEERHEAELARRAPSRRVSFIRSRSALHGRHVDLVERREVRRRAAATSSRCSAMRLRRVDIFSRVSRAPGGRRAARGGATGAAARRGAALARRAGRCQRRACSTTSGLLTTPPRPVPGTVGEVHALLGRDALRRGRCAHFRRRRARVPARVPAPAPARCAAGARRSERGAAALAPARSAPRRRPRRARRAARRPSRRRPRCVRASRARR